MSVSWLDYLKRDIFGLIFGSVGSAALASASRRQVYAPCTHTHIVKMFRQDKVMNLSLKALGLSLSVISLSADQALKSWTHGLVQIHGNLDVIAGFRIVASMNSGVAFGLADEAGRWPLIVLGLGLTSLLIAWLGRTKSVPNAIGLGLVIGGAVGNVLDRLRFGAVRDFIDLYWRDYHWPAFNAADAAIVSGLLLVVLLPEGKTTEEGGAAAGGEKPLV